MFPQLLSDPADMLISSKEAMKLLGYRDAGSFWNCVYTQGVPHVRINARNIKFPLMALLAWLQRRSNFRCA